MQVTGFHHVTCVGSHPQANLEFYAGVLGFRLIKKTVHFDQVNVYHLYYGDDTGRPGSVLTFFPFPNPEPAIRGADAIQEIALAVPVDSCSFWTARLEKSGVATGGWVEDFGERVMRFHDHDGQRLKLVASPGCEARSYWQRGPVAESHAIRGLQGIHLGVVNVEPELDMATRLLGLRHHATNGRITRLTFAGGEQEGRHVDIEDMKGVPAAPRLPLEGALAMAGTANHVAFNTETEKSQRAFRDELVSAGFTVTQVKDRHYFTSIYLIDPGGIRVEIATSDRAGFTKDEKPDRLGESLALPPWLAHRRARYEAALPPIGQPPSQDG